MFRGLPDASYALGAPMTSFSEQTQSASHKRKLLLGYKKHLGLPHSFMVNIMSLFTLERLS